MSTRLSRQGVQETLVIDVLGKMRQQVGNHLARLAPWLEIPEWFGDVAGRAFECHFGDAGCPTRA